MFSQIDSKDISLCPDNEEIKGDDDEGSTKFEIKVTFAIADLIKELGDTEAYDLANRLYESWR